MYFSRSEPIPDPRGACSDQPRFLISADGGKTFADAVSGIRQDHALWIDPDDPTA
jgi:hypothetical protein